MCESIGLPVLNGRTQGDVDGSFTFLRGESSSAIDFGLADEWWLNRVQLFQIQELPYSDHFPLTIEVDINTPIQENPANYNLLPKLILQERHIQHYKIELDREINFRVENFRSKEGASALAQCIRTVSNKFQPPPRNFTPKQPWFDASCATARRKTFLTLKQECFYNIQIRIPGSQTAF